MAPAPVPDPAAAPPHWRRLLETRVPAPVAAFIVGAAMWLYARLDDLSTDGPTWRVTLAVALAQVSGVIALAAFGTFWHAHTTIDPFHPQRAARLVTHGIFRFTRNPLYLSLVLLLLAYALRLGSLPLVAGPLAFGLYMHWFQVMPEERVLTAKFGDDYRAYCQRTRRWI